MDYQAIVEGITLDKVKQLLYKLGAKEVIDKGTYLITNTICHNADAEEASLENVSISVSVCSLMLCH